MKEFDIIKKYLKPLSKNNSGAMNLTDDVYFDFKKNIAISVDTYVENKHFLFSNNPKLYLKKIFRSSISDLYAKGVKPTKYFFSLSLSKRKFNKRQFLELKKILYSEQKKFKVYLSGGDLTTSKTMSFTFVFIGKVQNKFILRSGAKILDDIYVTGNIGDSYIGLELLKKKKTFLTKNKNYFINKYINPDLPIKFSDFLYKFCNSSIDISDGIFQDLNHLLNYSRKGAFVDIDKLPLSSQLKKLIKNKNLNLKNIVSNGDDYQILFTSSKNNRDKIFKYSKISKLKVTRIGLITRDKKLKTRNHGKLIDFAQKKMGYTHIF